MGGNILLIDDNLINLMVLEEILVGDGHQVRSATSGELALKSITAQAPELILLDMLMPGMDGFEVCRRLKSSPSTSDIPVLFISALADMDNKLRAFEAGGVDYITKPFSELEVLARVRTHLRLAAAQLQLQQSNRELSCEIEMRKVAEQAILEAKKEWERTFDAISDPILILDAGFRIVRINRTMAEMLNMTPGEAIGQTCYQALHGLDAPLAACPHLQMVLDGRAHSTEIFDPGLGGHFQVGVSPLFDPEGKICGSIHFVRDISERKRIQKELDEKLVLLEAAIAKAKHLEGIIPICMYCKKIRDDVKSWHQLESYITKHSEAHFSHGICPECQKKMQAEIDSMA